MAWLYEAVRRWFALVAGAVSFSGVVAFAFSSRYLWAWLAIGALVLLAVSLGLTAREEHALRVKAEAREHRPPGGGKPLLAPVAYQVDALRQIVTRLVESMETFGYYELDNLLKNLPRSGVDPIYEPLSIGGCMDGLARLVELRELETVGAPPALGQWRIVTR